MKPKYSEAFIEQARVKLLARGERTIQSVAQELNVNYYTAKNWIKRTVPAKVASSAVKQKRPQDWSAKEQLIALYKTYGMSGESLNAWRPRTRAICTSFDKLGGCFLYPGTNHFTDD
jgi:transposase